MKAWSEETGKNIKMATKPFKAQIDTIPEQYKQQIAQQAYEEAKELFKAFKAEGTATALFELLGG